MKTLVEQLSRRALPFVFALTFTIFANAVPKPTGTFSSSGATNDGIYANPNLRGVLIRADWATLEPTPGNYDFTLIEMQLAKVRANGVQWSLAVYGGGTGSPAWLTDPLESGGLGALFIPYTFRGEPGFKLPAFWDSTVQDRLNQLAVALAAQYNSDPDLALVYVTQMSANGIEGHLQGVNMADMLTAGYTDALWIEASKQASKSYAYAFADKPIAFEVHEVNGGATVPETIIYDLWNDPTLEYRVGAGMWWISGKTSYQPDLVAILSDFPGDIYGQVIGKSGEGPWKPNTSYRRRDIRMPDPQLLTNAFRYEVIVAGESGDTQPDWPTTNGATVEDGTVVWKCRSSRFEGGDYTSVFAQAKAIGMRYIEPWEWEFKYGDNSANGVWNAALADFNNWADSVYNQNLTPPETPTGLIATAGNAQVELDWDDNVELDLLGYIVYRSLNAGGPYEAVNAGLLSASEYIDDTVANDTTYYYVVTAADASANESGDSSEVSATPSEGNGPVTLLKDGFESDFSLWAGDGATDWTRVTEQARTGVYSANAGSDSNDLVPLTSMRPVSVP